ncbi:MAG: S46 family peptidase [Bacteroidota bacterium]|nr:S46 family peptidase [Bacteroidota bacterium]
MNLNRIYFILVLLSAASFAFISFKPDEGMYPLSEIRKLDLKNAGLKIDVNEIYSPGKAGLIDALVNITGCTGSFVSADGLIITNHHCAFGAVAQASTTENNYLENGFLAKTREQEITAKGITAKITVSYDDVSSEILKAANESGDYAKRPLAIANKIKEIIAREEKKNPEIKAEVSEMFAGESYILFRYQTINDVRLVYVPPRNIGEFGGESDNWVWPRHTGDFSFLRAYVSRDGKPAPYSKDNVPFHPKKFLKINPNGVKENDFVFVLGYPGRTFKHQPSQFLEMQQNYQLPYIQKMYSWLIALYQKYGADDAEYALKMAPRIKGLANAEKNYRGKLIGLKRLDIIGKKQSEEINLQAYINSDIKLKGEYGNTLKDIDGVYSDIFSLGVEPFFTSMLSNSAMYRLADILLDYQDEILKPEKDRKTAYQVNHKADLMAYIKELYSSMYKDVDKVILTKIISDGLGYKEVTSLKAYYDIKDKKSAESKVAQFYANSLVRDADKFIAMFNDKPVDLKSLNDPLVEFARLIREENKEIALKGQERSGKMNVLLAKFLDVKRLWQNKAFAPDANSTLRLTYGYIKGYSPVDAAYYSPQTSLRGIIEKAALGGDYPLNKVLKELYDKKDFGRYKDDKLNDVPVAMLYNTDTSGGNSGSPVLNAYGELIGVNYDRSFEATINDYAWNENYSRSIGVDIRYVLWVAQKISGADNLIKELGVQ